MPRIEDAALAVLRATHGELMVLTVGEDDIVVRMPTPVEFDDFIGRSSDKTTIGSALRTLAHDCRVFPDKPALAAMFAAKPALAGKVAEACTKLAGADLKVDSKKA